MCPNDKMHSPVPCANGTFANKTKSSECKICPVGFTCFDPRQTPIKCNDGYYSNGGTSACVICPAGHR